MILERKLLVFLKLKSNYMLFNKMKIEGYLMYDKFSDALIGFSCLGDIYTYYVTLKIVENWLLMF